MCHCSEGTTKNSLGTLDVELNKHIGDKNRDIVDYTKLIEAEQLLTAQLDDQIETAERERQYMLSDKKRLTDELNRRVIGHLSYYWSTPTRPISNFPDQ